jgi:cell shape-determining protein MreC
MSYLLDRKIKRKKLSYIALFVFICLVLFYFRLGIGSALSAASHAVFRPVFIVGNFFGDKLGGLGSYFAFKNSLYRQNQDLQSKIAEYESRLSNHNSVLEENINLKETLGRKNENSSFVLSAILSKPNKSPYDTLILDVGTDEGVKVGDLVFAFGSTPLGRVSDVYSNSSKVVLFSNSGEKTQVVISGGDIFMEIVGRGGGNFEMILPRDLVSNRGDEVVLPGIVPHVVAIVEKIISDPRDPFIKALLVSPVNIQELKFVEVEI